MEAQTTPRSAAEEPTTASIDELEEDDADSGLADDDEGRSTLSLDEDTINYQVLRGRTYHNSYSESTTVYWYPLSRSTGRSKLTPMRGANDKPQSKAMNSYNDTYRDFTGRMQRAELAPDIQRVLDIGTGTGSWAVQFGECFPSATVIGTDLSPIQPGMVPPNVFFEVVDCGEKLPYKDNRFDYVHMRFLSGSIRNWDSLVAEILRVLKPGGIFESSEPSPVIETDHGRSDENSACQQLVRILDEYGKMVDQTFAVVRNGLQEDCMVKAGFTDIQVKTFKFPLGQWQPDENGKETRPWAQGMMDDLEGFILRPATSIGWSWNEVQVFLALLRKEIMSGKMNLWCLHKDVWGRKPHPTLET